MNAAVFALLTGVVVVVLFLSKRRGRLVRGATLAMAGLAAAWLAVVLAVSQGWRDVDGAIDCNDSCSRIQGAAGVVLFWAPMLFLLLGGLIFFAYYRPARRDQSELGE
jgi:hypothetical protein